jgi:hypothetical protein
MVNCTCSVQCVLNNWQIITVSFHVPDKIHITQLALIFNYRAVHIFIKLCTMYRVQSGLNKETSMEDRQSCVMERLVICTQIIVCLV